jgi:hypothetical protein
LTNSQQQISQQQQLLLQQPKPTLNGLAIPSQPSQPQSAGYILPPHLQAQLDHQQQQFQFQQSQASSLQPPFADPRSLPPVHAPPNPSDPSQPIVPQLDAPALLPDGSGRSLFELDLEALERKDWRLPGSDISDWFNYGFDEFTWVEYVRRRREMEGMVENMGMVRLDSLLPCPLSP